LGLEAVELVTAVGKRKQHAAAGTDSVAPNEVGATR